MADPTAPTNLSAEATNETTAELRWSAPDDDGGFDIDFYSIDRDLNGAGFAVLIADTGDDSTAFTDSTLSARDNAVYQVSATNTEPSTGPTSDTASTTTSTSEAQTIQELLFDNWTLTGELSKTVVVGPPDMTEVVNFLDRGQIPGNKVAKAVAVQKINELGNESIVEHPKFFEQSDTFEITCFLQVPDGADDVFSVWIDLMQQMTGEVTRILKTQFSPSTDTGEFFRTDTDWTRDDTFFPDDPMLVRTLRFILTRIKSTDDEVFLGYGGVLVFDTSASTGDNLPTSDFTFAQVKDAKLREGYAQIPSLTKDTTNGLGVPFLDRGLFSGTFSAFMYGKKSDIIGTTTEKLQNIYKTQGSSPLIGQQADVVFLQSNENTEATVVTLTKQSFMKIINIEEIDDTEDLVTYKVSGQLTKPTVFTEAS